MRRYIGLLATALVVLLIGVGAPQERAPSKPQPDRLPPDLGKAPYAPGQIVVKVKDSVPADAIASVNRRNSARLKERIPHTRVSLVGLPESLSVAEAIERYEASPEVEYAEPNYRVIPAVSAPTPNDPQFPKMYDLYSRGQSGATFDADIDAPEAWKATTGSTDTVVAVIDTGIDTNHRDLNDNIWTNPGESGVDADGIDKATNGVDDDGNGYVDDVHGWDFFNDDASVFDGARQDAHGTHVAGTIAAEGNNDLGVTGVSWQAKIMPLKFIGPGNASYVLDAAEAIYYSVCEGVEISNNSWGYDFDSTTLRDAIDYAEDPPAKSPPGCADPLRPQLLVVAAMNGGADFVGDNIDDPNIPDVYPASYDNPNIISVAATNNDDELTSFSNYGATSVDLAAPGRDILSTWPGNKYVPGYGTSMATPHVAGAAVLIKSQQPNLRVDQIKDAILNSVDKLPSLEGKLSSGGRLNIAKALGENTAPVIVDLRPSRKKLRDRTPIISTTVQDDETDLTQTQIQLYVDGRLKQSFSYDQVEDELTYKSRRLAPRRHRVQIVVDDGQGLQESRTWTFMVVDRRR